MVATFSGESELTSLAVAPNGVTIMGDETSVGGEMRKPVSSIMSVLMARKMALPFSPSWGSEPSSPRRNDRQFLGCKLLIMASERRRFPMRVLRGVLVDLERYKFESGFLFPLRGRGIN